jgi:hypothetical protein
LLDAILSEEDKLFMATLALEDAMKKGDEDDSDST